jgi:hypothetical protein
VTIAYIWSPAIDLIGAARWALQGHVNGAALAVAGVIVAIRLGIVRCALAARARIAATAALATGLPGLGLLVVFFRRGLSSTPPHTMAPRLLVVALPVVIAYASVFVLLAWPRLKANSHENADWTVVVGALWVGLPNAATTVLLKGARLPSAAASFLVVQGCFMVLLPLVLASAALAHVALRRRWLRLVGAGKLPPWQIVQGENLEGMEDPLEGQKLALRRSGFPRTLASGLRAVQPANPRTPTGTIRAGTTNVRRSPVSGQVRTLFDSWEG